MKQVQAKKHLGQHFLNDENIALRIVESINATSTNTILEIGPGMGVLTKYLRKLESECFYIEKDEESVIFLKENYPEISQNIIFGDFLQMNITEYSSGQTSIIGNFPYNISSQIFFKVLEHVDNIPEIVCMLQYEVALRISSPPGNKQYGILSVLLQSFYEVEFLFKVPPSVFTPPPKVDSAVIRLKRRADYKSTVPCNKKLFRTVVKTAFNQRRKMLSNSLKSLLRDNKLPEEIMKMRPEQLSVEDFVSLTQLIEKIQIE